MEIKHYANSFISVKSADSSIVCDPWLGDTDENAWNTYPLLNKKESDFKNNKPSYIYISHLHCDHFDKKTLNFFDKNTKIIIKNFKNKRLKNRIINTGFKNIVELDSWKIYKINKDFSVIIIPQITSNTSSIDEQVNYDLDTSIIIIENKTSKIFFNKVDNPLSNKDLKKIKEFINKQFNKNIDVLCMCVGAASEYPQCFLNINRNIEKDKVTLNYLNMLKKNIRTISPKVFFQAGGSYIINGKFSSLSKFIAQPNIQFLKKKLSDLNIPIHDIEGGGSISISNNIKFNHAPIKRSLKFFNKSVLKNSKIKYKYFQKETNQIINNLDYLINVAKNNYDQRLASLNLKTNFVITINIYKDIKLNKMHKIDSASELLKSFTLKNKNKNELMKLDCFLDVSLFYNLIKRRISWNVALSGSFVLFKRTPNKFEPNITFSLNYLAI